LNCVYLQLNPPPDYVEHRIKIWNELKTKYNEQLAAQTQVDISITLPDGKIMPGKSWKTTPNDIAQSIRYVVRMLLVFDGNNDSTMI
jgi:threonyl-tRNA synthetase